MPQSEDKRWVRAAGALASVIDDDLVILNLARNNYVALNPIGREVWELLAAPHTPAELVETLCARYDVTAEQCLAEVMPFLSELAAEQLIHVAAG